MWLQGQRSCMLLQEPAEPDKYLQLLLPSVRNSSWMNKSLLEQTNCTKFLYPSEMSQKVQDLQGEKSGIEIFLVESLSDMLLGHAKYYPYECNYTDVRWDPVLVLLSSGSTGETSSGTRIDMKSLYKATRTP